MNIVPRPCDVARLTRHRASVALAVLLVALGILVAVPGASHADGDVTSFPGYLDRRDPDAYMRDGAWQVLHIETDHMTDEGFWYAIYEDNSYLDGSTPYSVRNMSWVFQRWGMWCDGPYKVIGWNEWLGGERCGPDVAKLTAEFPDYPNQVAACRASTGHDYMDARPVYYADDTLHWYCDDWVIDDTRLTDSNAILLNTYDYVTGCAPWERQDFDGYGYESCLHEFYPWLNDPRMPDGGYAGPAPAYTRSASSRATSTQSSTSTATWTDTSSVTRGHRTAFVTGTVHGHRVTVRGSAPVVMSATATATRTATETATSTRRSHAECTRPTIEDAQACAQEKAQAQAEAAAAEYAGKLAQQKANSSAKNAAVKAAIQAARTKAKRAKVTKAAIAAADKAARQDAIDRLNALK